MWNFRPVDLGRVPVRNSHKISGFCCSERPSATKAKAGRGRSRLLMQGPIPEILPAIPQRSAGLGAGCLVGSGETRGWMCGTVRPTLHSSSIAAAISGSLWHQAPYTQTCEALRELRGADSSCHLPGSAQTHTGPGHAHHSHLAHRLPATDTGCKLLTHVFYSVDGQTALDLTRQFPFLSSTAFVF